MANPQTKTDLAALDQLERHLYAHRYASTSFTTYGSTIDPPAVTSDRAEVLAILAEEDHALLCDPDTGALLDRLAGQELDDVRRAQVRVLCRRRSQMVDVPATDQSAFARLVAEADAVWRRTKVEDDWDGFEPYLDRMVSLMRRIALERWPDADPYDTWLDYNEAGSSRAFYDEFFAEVKKVVVPLLARIRACGYQPSRACIDGRFDPDEQWRLARDVSRLEGVDPDAWWLTATEHPFSAAPTSHYAITAAHVHADDVTRNLFTMLHEGGHNLYEQNIDPRLNHTSLANGTSAGIHEGQSRFFENYVGRDRAFAPTLLGLLQRHFPQQMAGVTAEEFWRATNRVDPQPIRTEADELTYPLHIVIRYELEQLLFAGEISAHDVPALWNQKYHDYLGVDVPCDRDGALQDMHWAGGLMGYFPTYALGNAYGAQLRDAMLRDGLDWEGTLSRGDLAPIRAWLRDRIWRWGRAKEPDELIRGACGKPFDPTYYTRYLEEKFTALYGL